MLKCKHVCFDCRLSFKQSRYNAPKPKCPECAKELINIGYRIPIPKKRHGKKWKSLRESFFERLRKSDYYIRTHAKDEKNQNLIRRLIKP
jgi:hypothetical protein